MNPAEKKILIYQYDAGRLEPTEDVVAAEVPLEIRLVTGPAEKRRGKGISITMRTPGHDRELAVGFLVSEGIINAPTQIQRVDTVGSPDDNNQQNTVRIELTPETEVDYLDLQRHFYTTSSCGVCSKASLESLENRDLSPVQTKICLDADLISELPEKLRQQQTNFQRTGGIHAAGLFDASGQLLRVHEDVGRHNALDKLIGSYFLEHEFPLKDLILVVSGRASFELLQKALVAQIPFLIAVGAPSSLAVDLATQFDLTLVGFASKSRFNIYSSPERIVRPNK